MQHFSVNRPTGAHTYRRYAETSVIKRHASWVVFLCQDPSTRLSMRHEGSAIVVMRATIGSLAGLTPGGRRTLCPAPRQSPPLPQPKTQEMAGIVPRTAKAPSAATWVAGSLEIAPGGLPA